MQVPTTAIRLSGGMITEWFMLDLKYENISQSGSCRLGGRVRCSLVFAPRQDDGCRAMGFMIRPCCRASTTVQSQGQYSVSTPEQLGHRIARPRRPAGVTAGAVTWAIGLPFFDRSEERRVGKECVGTC